LIRPKTASHTPRNQCFLVYTAHTPTNTHTQTGHQTACYALSNQIMWEIHTGQGLYFSWFEEHHTLSFIHLCTFKW